MNKRLRPGDEEKQDNGIEFGAVGDSIEVNSVERFTSPQLKG